MGLSCSTHCQNPEVKECIPSQAAKAMMWCSVDDNIPEMKDRDVNTLHDQGLVQVIHEGAPARTGFDELHVLEYAPGSLQEAYGDDEYPTPALDFQRTNSTLRSTSRFPEGNGPGAVSSTMNLSPEQKEAAKQQVKEKIQAFKAEAQEGIKLCLLLTDEWRYVSAKFIMNWTTKKIQIEAEQHAHAFSLSDVQGIYNFWEGSALWHGAYKSVAPVDRHRAIVLYITNMKLFCFLESDAGARDYFVSSMSILQEYAHKIKASPRSSPSSPRKEDHLNEQEERKE